MRWDAIAGLKDAKKLLKEAVVMPHKYPQFFHGACPRPEAPRPGSMVPLQQQLAQRRHSGLLVANRAGSGFGHGATENGKWLLNDARRLSSRDEGAALGTGYARVRWTQWAGVAVLSASGCVRSAIAIERHGAPRIVSGRRVSPRAQCDCAGTGFPHRF